MNTEKKNDHQPRLPWVPPTVEPLSVTVLTENSMVGAFADGGMGANAFTEMLS